MRLEILAVYAGPDQVMTVTSGLASIVGVLLIFWHKVIAAFDTVVHKLRGSTVAEASAKNTPPQNP